MMTDPRLSSRIFVAGHNGMVGSAIVRKLKQGGFEKIITAERTELDLLDQHATLDFFVSNKFSRVYLAAARVGGIHANNTYPVDFLYENLTIQNNVIHAAHTSGVQKLLFLGSSCIYPKLASQPISEQALLTGALEQTNEPYAIAKIAGIKLCESYNRQYQTDYRSVMPTNLYGPNDNFHPENSHVIPALFRRFHNAVEAGASEMVIWGSGSPRREFLHVDDMASACLHVMELAPDQYAEHTTPNLSHINVGTGLDCTIAELATLIAEVSGFNGRLTFDTSKPDGTPRKLLDVSRLSKLGWSSSIPLREGLAQAYAWYLSNVSHARS